ncbi:MAG: FmdB family transcriptional regulator [Acidimicrobiia bacterium]|nr:FmdB family transcriptional regulator [Acidimicrobiia bacterium]
MPTYSYRCGKCGEQFETWQSITDEPLKRHRGCGGKLVKVLSPVGIVLKGSGFYKTDNGSRSKGARREKTEKTETSESSKPAETPKSKPSPEASTTPSKAEAKTA